MRVQTALLFLVGTLLTAGGYGATFLLSMRFRAIGGSDLDTGAALAAATVGTFAGLAVVGWFSRQIGAARIAALSSLCIGAGIVGFALVGRAPAADLPSGFLVGFGWGAFHLAAPMSLAERTSGATRNVWFFRSATFQMTGIGMSPAFSAYAMRLLHWSIDDTLYAVGALCAIASLMFEAFGRLCPHPPAAASGGRWVRELRAISRTRAAAPIAMIALGTCVFSGLMTFQMSLMQGTQARAGTFFSLYTMTVLSARWLLGKWVRMARPETATKGLLMMMMLGALAMFGAAEHASLQSVVAVLLGAGYGLMYPVIQAQALHDCADTQRHGVLTWFVASYFIGTFGFPSVGGWVMVHAGKGALLMLIASCGLVALSLAFLHDRPAPVRTR
ncbi:MFS transporter [Burkholderia diffusa]|uniref:MFS transporter n=1 Tax=Burkholderia diffusa TaxID=488732 RepID=A0A6P2K0D0_9BURK|nr:MFS transporter [Burkholderia diffusa]KAB0655291.1 MFS transporter [Burkholderia diffusa]MBM2653801.1 MFS transporter [Burkholderia diffusa]VWB48877.1 MFS transporter [Burkholderia diffusa]